MASYTVVMKVGTSKKVKLEKLKEYLENNVILDVDVEEESPPEGLVIEIDWETLKKE